MGLSNLLGMGIGALIIASSKLFWLNVCYYVAETYETLTETTCGGFESFFFWAGVIIMVISFIGLFRRK